MVKGVESGPALNFCWFLSQKDRTPLDQGLGYKFKLCS